MKKIFNKIFINERGAMNKLIISFSIVIIGVCTILISQFTNDSENIQKVETAADIEAYMNKFVPAAGPEDEIQTITSDRKALSLDK
jgi:hypothetical protein